MRVLRMGFMDFGAEAMRRGRQVTYRGAQVMFQYYGGGNPFVNVDLKELRRWSEYSDPYQALADFSTATVYDVFGGIPNDPLSEKSLRTVREYPVVVADIIAGFLTDYENCLAFPTGDGNIVIYE